MGYSSSPGTLGRDPDSGGGTKPADTPPVTGLPDEAEALAGGGPKVTRVTRDWGDPPTPNVTKTPKIRGATLKEALTELQKLPEWGTGGGNLTDPKGGQMMLTTQDGKNYTIEMHGDFFITLPDWEGYEKATTAQKQAWDAMIANLRKHEQEHVRIAYKNAQKLIRALTNLPADQAPQKIAELAQEGQDQQDDFDSAAKTDHGKNDFQGFAKVELDTSADPPPPQPKP